MVEFLQSYGIWIIFGLLFLFMLRGRGHGMGCCGSHQRVPETVKGKGQQDTKKHGSGCH